MPKPKKIKKDDADQDIEARRGGLNPYEMVKSQYKIVIWIMIFTFLLSVVASAFM